MSPFGARLDVSPCLQRAPQSGSRLSPFGTGTGPGAGELGRELDFDSWPQKNQRLKRPHHRVSPLVFHKDDDPQRKRPYHKHPVRSGKHTRGHPGPNIWALNSSANGKPGGSPERRPESEGRPWEGTGKAYVGAGIYACGSIEGRAWSLRLGLVYIMAIGLHSMTRSDGTYELDMRQGPAKPRPGLDLGQGLGPGFTRVLPLGPGQGHSSGPGAPFKQARAWAGLQCYRAGIERIEKGLHMVSSIPAPIYRPLPTKPTKSGPGPGPWALG